MAHIKFNHFNSSAFNSFVPEAAKVANNQFLKNVFVVGGVILVLWLIFKPQTDTLHKKKEEKE
jgi:hypothetical protein